MPIPEAARCAALNALLLERCRTDQQRVMARRTRAIAALLAEERPQLVPLPAHPVEVGALRAVLARSTGRVRFETNDYSVPVR